MSSLLFLYLPCGLGRGRAKNDTHHRLAGLVCLRFPCPCVSIPCFCLLHRSLQEVSVWDDRSWWWGEDMTRGRQGQTRPLRPKDLPFQVICSVEGRMVGNHRKIGTGDFPFLPLSGARSCSQRPSLGTELLALLSTSITVASESSWQGELWCYLQFADVLVSHPTLLP